jgi:poly-gamma-glutamate capsule biosynthesis protein CapA/YwtB (metallophosphatase superfamily)
LRQIGAVVSKSVDPKGIRISLAGDVFIPDTSFVNVGVQERNTVRSRFAAPFEGADLVLLNFEAPVTDAPRPQEQKRYNLRNSSDCLELFDDRFVLSLANNHIMDYGEAGLTSTIEQMTARGLPFGGAGINIEEASKPAFIERAGVKVAIICAADPRFQPAGPSSPGTLPAHSDLLVRIIGEAKDQADFVVLSVHAGMEFTSVPTPFMINLVDQCLTAGAQIIGFHHTHCLSGFTQKHGQLVIWGAGNYAFPYNIPRGFSPWFHSAVWNVTIDQDHQMVKTDLVPIVIDRNGFPCMIRGSLAGRISAGIRKYSLRIDGRHKLWFWRLCSLLRPVYLWLAINNYAGMARRKGWKSVVKHVTSAWMLYFRGKTYELDKM